MRDFLRMRLRALLPLIWTTILFYKSKLWRTFYFFPWEYQKILLEPGNNFLKKIFERYREFQPPHNVKTTLIRRHFNVLTSYQRPYNVVLTSCASWTLSRNYTGCEIYVESNQALSWDYIYNKCINNFFNSNGR